MKKKIHYIGLLLLVIFFVGNNKVTTVFSNSKSQSTYQSNALPDLPTDAKNSKVDVGDAFKMINDASIKEKNVVQIVSGEKKKVTGALWYKYQIDLKKDFEFDGYVFNGYQKTPEGLETGDGLTFTFHNDPRGVNAQGGAGGGLGAYGMGGMTGDVNGAIANALSIEIDLYENKDMGTAFDVPGMGVPTDALYPHAALLIPGTYVEMASTNKHMGIVYPTTKMEQDKVWSTQNHAFWNKLKVKWNSQTQDFSWQFADFPEQSKKIDPLTTFGSEKVWWGFTGSTGGASTPFGVAIKKLPQTPDMDVIKKVKNVTKGDTSFTEKTYAEVGDELEYKIDVMNKKESIVPLVQTKLIEDIGYTDFVSGSLDVSGNMLSDPTITSGNFTIPLQDIQPNETISVTFKVKVKKANADSKVTNTAKITSTYSEEQQSNTVEIIISPNVHLKKEVNKTSAKSGDELTYVLELSNAENAGTWNGQLIDELDHNLMYIANSTTIILPNGTSQTISDTVWSHQKLATTSYELKAGETMKLSFKAKISMKEGIHEKSEILNQGKVTSYTIDAIKLPDKYSDEATTKLLLPSLHIRQVILSPQASLPIVSTGYFQLNQVDKDSLANIEASLNIKTPSDEDMPSVGFQEINLRLTSETERTIIAPIIPEYFTYSGFRLTETNKQHHAEDREKDKTQPILLDFTNWGEYWVTVYLTPTTNHPRPYSWDYQRQEIGELRP